MTPDAKHEDSDMQMAESTDSPTMEVLENTCGQIHQTLKPRHPWPPWYDHDGSAPEGGYL